MIVGSRSLGDLLNTQRNKQSHVVALEFFLLINITPTAPPAFLDLRLTFHSPFKAFISVTKYTMPRPSNKRKQVEEVSAHETSRARSNKAPRKRHVLSGVVSSYPPIKAMLHDSLQRLGSP